mgnify:CR=1 FL=1
MQYTECLAVVLSLIAVFQTWYSIRKSNRPYISIQLIPYNKRLYLKIKNNGNQDAKINNVSYLGAAEIENINRDHMPLNNCNPFTLAPNEAKLGLIDMKLINSEIEIKYSSGLRRFTYKRKLESLGTNVFINSEDRPFIDTLR